MFLVSNPALQGQIPADIAGLIALLGYAVVFIGLIALMCVILIEGKISVSSKKKAEAAKPAQAAPAPAAKPAQAAPAPAAKPEPVPAPGAAGELKLHNVPAKDAAILMAIVAYKLGKPVNELRFKSIKEVQ